MPHLVLHCLTTHAKKTNTGLDMTMIDAPNETAIGGGLLALRAMIAAGTVAGHATEATESVTEEI
jgi:hypothetical protein